MLLARVGGWAAAPDTRRRTRQKTALFLFLRSPMPLGHRGSQFLLRLFSTPPLAGATPAAVERNVVRTLEELVESLAVHNSWRVFARRRALNCHVIWTLTGAHQSPAPAPTFEGPSVRQNLVRILLVRRMVPDENDCRGPDGADVCESMGPLAASPAFAALRRGLPG